MALAALEQAKKDGFVARSVYKLEEIDARFALFSRGDKVLDLGCAPGSWLQYVSAKIGAKGRVIGYDLAEMKVGSPNAATYIADVYELTPSMIIEDSDIEQFDAVISDMAPKTTGIRDADQARSIGLVENALALAQVLLKEEGVFAAKVFQGRGFDELMKTVRISYKEVRALRPKAV